MTRIRRAMTGAMLTVAIAAPAWAQGKSEQHKGKPPSSSPLPSPTTVAPPAPGTVPFAWIDDASVLPAGTTAWSLSALRWQGPDVGETYAPVVGVVAGVAPRLQVGVSVPRVVADDTIGLQSGLGTSYLSAKIALPMRAKSHLKVAFAPTLEILGTGSLQALPPGESRVHFGLPVSVEVDRKRVRLFGGGGFFSQGVLFAGGGVALELQRRWGASAALSRAWTTDALGAIATDRKELSGSLAYSPRSRISVFGSIGQTVGTTDQDGAGTTISGGVMFLLVPAVPK
jgi:hypothetical protein